MSYETITIASAPSAGHPNTPTSFLPTPYSIQFVSIFFCLSLMHFPLASFSSHLPAHIHLLFTLSLRPLLPSFCLYICLCTRNAFSINVTFLSLSSSCVSSGLSTAYSFLRISYTRFVSVCLPAHHTSACFHCYRYALSYFLHVQCLPSFYFFFSSNLLHSLCLSAFISHI